MQMQGEARKLNLIGEILKIEDETVLDEVEGLLFSKKSVTGRRNVTDFAGIWTADEGDEMKRIIEESCAQINPDDWK